MLEDEAEDDKESAQTEENVEKGYEHWFVIMPQ